MEISQFRSPRPAMVDDSVYRRLQRNFRVNGLKNQRFMAIGSDGDRVFVAPSDLRPGVATLGIIARHVKFLDES